MSDPRYFEVWAANEANRIEATSKAAEMDLVGICDDWEGGIIGYVIADHADLILTALNKPMSA